jgi:hypothetical protein
MTPERQRPYGKWSSQELRNAESTASQFLDENRDQIADTLRAKARLLEALIQRIGSKKTTFEERLEFFARVAEVAQLIEEDADGFFRLASEPVVARILSGVSKK